MDLVTAMRTLLELAYMYAYGPEGTSDMRDELHEARWICEPYTGQLSYSGNGVFSWILDNYTPLEFKRSEGEVGV